jgi:hypothetical protein
MSRISRPIAALLTVALAIATALPLAAERSGHEFGAHKFTLDLPSGYTLDADANPRPGFGTFGFATPARDDGTHGMIQVSLMDFSSFAPGETVTLEKFATAMIDGVHRRRTHWEQTESEVQVDGVRGKRYEWAGSTELGFGRPPTNMRGVMLVGVKKNLGFSLHTQDFVAFAPTTLPLCEQALQTFTLTVHR